MSEILEVIEKLSDKIESIEKKLTEVPATVNDYATQKQNAYLNLRNELCRVAKAKEFGKEIVVTKATNIEGTDNLGGYLVPTEKGPFLYSVNEWGLARKHGTIVPMARDKQDMPYPSTDLVAYNVNEAATGTASNYVFGNLQLDTQKYIAMAPFSSELLEDSLYPIEQIVGNSFDIQFSGAEDTLLNTRFNSIATTYGTTGSVTGSFTNTVTGGDVFVTNVLQPLQAGLASTNVGYIEGAGYVMAPSVWFTILSWSDTTKSPLANLVDPVNMTLRGQPVYLSNKFTNATATTSGKVVIAYGNLKNIFLGDRVQMQVDLFNQGTFGTTNAMESDLIVFRGRSRFDIELKPDAFWVYRLK